MTTKRSAFFQANGTGHRPGETAAVAVTALAAIKLPLLTTVVVGVGAVVLFKAMAV